MQNLTNESPLNNIGFRRAFEAATHSPGTRYRVGAAIYRQGRFISSGWNSGKTHPQSGRRTKNICSELHAILKAKGDTKNCQIYIVRINKKLDLLPIHPCEHCRAVIEKAGIKIFHAAQNNSSFVTEELC